MKPQPFTSFKTSVPAKGDIVEVLHDGKIGTFVFVGMLFDTVKLSQNSEKDDIEVYNGLASWRPRAE